MHGQAGAWPTGHVAEGGWAPPGAELWRSRRLHACSLSISLTSTSCEFLGYSEASPSPVSFPVKSPASSSAGVSKSTLSHRQHTQSKGWQSWRNERPDGHSGSHLDEFQAEPMAFLSLKERRKQGMQFKSIWAQCPQGGAMNFLNQNTHFPAHPVCAPSWYSPHRAPCRSPRPSACPHHVLLCP